MQSCETKRVVARFAVGCKIGNCLGIKKQWLKTATATTAEVLCAAQLQKATAGLPGAGVASEAETRREEPDKSRPGKTAPTLGVGVGVVGMVWGWRPVYPI
mgnify:CR=1 FL=1